MDRNMPNQLATDISRAGDLTPVFTGLLPHPLLGDGAERRTRCPFHEDRMPSMSINVRTGLWCCHNPSCPSGTGGDVFEFVERLMHIDFNHALNEVARRINFDVDRWLEERNGSRRRYEEVHRRETRVLAEYAAPPAGLALRLPAPAPPPRDDPPPLDQEVWLTSHRRLLGDPDRLAWLFECRGLRRDTISERGLGWDGARYTIPILDAAGACVNIRRYNRELTPKMLNFFTTYGRARLYPLDQLAEARTRVTPIFLFEGELDALLATQSGLCAISVTGGAGTWRDEFTELFRDLTVLICYDCDDAGRAGSLNVARALATVATRVWRFDLDPARMDGYDFTDYVLGGGNVPETFIVRAMREAELVGAATAVAVEPAPPETPPPPSSGDDDDGPTDPLGGNIGGTTDDANALRFERDWRPRARHAVGLGWYLWDDRIWRRDEAGLVMDCARVTARKIGVVEVSIAQFSTPDDTAKIDKLTRHGHVSLNMGRLQAMVGLATATRPLQIPVEQLDRDRFRFTVANGEIDLHTGRREPFAQEHYITKLVEDVEYDPNATCPMWERFIAAIMRNNPRLIGFLQRAVGYSLTGSVTEEVMFICWGSGANGKSTMLETLNRLLGLDVYATPMPFSTLSSRREGGPSEDLAKLRGLRFVTAIESNMGQSLNEAVVKQLTGGDAIAARFLHENSFTYHPQFKIWLATNFRPRISGADDAIWRRIRLVPFEQRFDNDPQLRAAGAVLPKRDKDELMAELWAERSGILNWAIRGCLSWQRDGLGAPPEVMAATRAYRAEMDDTGSFLADRCEIAPTLSVAAADLYDAYRVWCGEQDRDPISNVTFGRDMTRRGFATRRGTGGRVVRTGVRLHDTTPDEDAAREPDRHAAQMPASDDTVQPNF
jgi:putative DNA primase/helicase